MDIQIRVQCCGSWSQKPVRGFKAPEKVLSALKSPSQNKQKKVKNLIVVDYSGNFLFEKGSDQFHDLQVRIEFVSSVVVYAMR